MIDSEYGPRAKEIAWLNNTVTFHSAICGCEKPWKHLEDILKTQKIRCQYTTEEDGFSLTEEKDGKQEEDHLDSGDLERLFADDFTDDTR